MEPPEWHDHAATRPAQCRPSSTLQTTLHEAIKPHAQKLSIDACLAQGTELPRLELAQRAATVQPDEARLERMPGDRSRSPTTDRGAMSYTQRVHRTLVLAPASEPVCSPRGRWRGCWGCSTASFCSCCPRRSPTPRRRRRAVSGCPIRSSRSSSGPSAAQHVDSARLGGGSHRQHGLRGGRPPLPGCSPRPGKATRSHAASWL